MEIPELAVADETSPGHEGFGHIYTDRRSPGCILLPERIR